MSIYRTMIINNICVFFFYTKLLVKGDIFYQTYNNNLKIKYKLDTEAKGSTGFRILKTLM